MSLPYLASADPSSIISIGHSAGGQFSHTLHIIHSLTFKGIGNMQGGPYGSQFTDFSNSSMTANVLSKNAKSAIDSYSASGDIDPTATLAKSAVYITSGANDTIVSAKN